jgi:hypothetical protein
MTATLDHFKGYWVAYSNGRIGRWTCKAAALRDLREAGWKVRMHVSIA